MFDFKKLYQVPEVNPKTGKAMSIPVLNLVSPYGRCFHLSWLGFFVSFLSWFAFPPLLAHSIKKDLNLTSVDIANNNIAGLSATLIGRVIMGPICDKIGPRYAMVLVLLLGSVPTAFVPLVYNVRDLHAIRFFIGLLGSSFIPCQVWTTTFFDKSIVGSANAFAGGFGNAGGGVAFFMMPAIVNGLKGRGYSQHQSWSYAFVVGPLIILLFVALLCVLFGQDCPEGKWSQRGDVLHIGVDVRSVDIVSIKSNHPVLSNVGSLTKIVTEDKIPSNIDEKMLSSPHDTDDHIHVVQTRVKDVVDLDQIVEDPSIMTFISNTFNYRTMLVALPYVITFGGELAIESVLSALYLHRSSGLWTESKSGSWASMIGLLNVVTRPLGGIVSDFLYKTFKTTKAKKFWLLFCAFMEGLFLLWIGLVPQSKLNVHSLIASISVMCIFMEAGNGACFSLVPHINPKNIGVVSGTTGAFGNMGGIFFSLVFRFNINADGTNNYMRGFWIIGVCAMSVACMCTLIPVREDRPDFSYEDLQDKV
uniref:Nitrate/nitrite transporter n=1 Tax=Cyberlindnera americana TaxID=36016 RepID=A0A5P8N9I7_9ASCO|nr:MFS transporter [Cyberlindnera americana]